MMKLIRVCVIGAGGAGLAAARHLTSEMDTLTCLCLSKLLLLVEHGFTTRKQAQMNEGF